MKNLIITLGAVILILNMMSFQFQCNDLIRELRNLKFACDEAAASAGLCFDEESYSQGLFRFDRKTASAKVEEMVTLNLREESKLVSWDVTFDEEGESPSLEVTLKKGEYKVKSKYQQVSP